MFKIGDVVYESYNPRFVGRVIEVSEKGTRKPMTHTKRGKKINWTNNKPRTPIVDVKVRWMNGFETYEESRLLGDLLTLINSTRKKLTSHSLRYAKTLVNISITEGGIHVKV